MNVTEEVLRALCRLAGDEGARVVSVYDVEKATTLDADELRTALAVLDLTGMLVQSPRTGTDAATVQLTVRGAAWCRESHRNR